MQVTNEKEADRALKRYVSFGVHAGTYVDLSRLRTRIAFVQNSEEKLGEKQEHCKLTQS